MINLIQNYLDKETEDFNDLVGKLEGTLDASEIKDNLLITKWYDLWTPLEIRRATGNNQEESKIIEELKALQNFLQQEVGE